MWNIEAFSSFSKLLQIESFFYELEWVQQMANFFSSSGKTIRYKDMSLHNLFAQKKNQYLTVVLWKLCNGRYGRVSLGRDQYFTKYQLRAIFLFICLQYKLLQSINAHRYSKEFVLNLQNLMFYVKFCRCKSQNLATELVMYKAC